MAAFRISLKKSAIIAAGLIVGGYLAMHGYWWLDARLAGRSEVARASIVLTDNDMPVVNVDHIQMYIAILRSPYLMDRAIKKGDLAGLKSMENIENPIEFIRAGLTAKPETPVDGVPVSKLLLTYRNSNASDCEKILTTVSENFQNYLVESRRQARLDAEGKRG